MDLVSGSGYIYRRSHSMAINVTVFVLQSKKMKSVINPNITVCRLPVLENMDDLNLEDSMNNVGSAMLSRFPRWFVLSHIEIQQCQLASTLLAASRSKWTIIAALVCWLSSLEAGWCCVNWRVVGVVLTEGWLVLCSLEAGWCCVNWRVVVLC